MATKPNYVEILTEAFAAAHKAVNERGSGCGRVYVCITSKEHRRGISAAARRLGKIYQARGAYGATNVLYVGYDNSTGKELAMGTAIVDVLRSHGIQCFREEFSD